MLNLPSAGVIRFRFNGFAKSRLSQTRHPEVNKALSVLAGVVNHIVATNAACFGTLQLRLVAIRYYCHAMPLIVDVLNVTF